jgi:DNA repair protein RecN (Recombination protein N)
MLTTLFIKNFALIDQAEITFQKGLNIVTGESGAGKSILVNAISQLCGERSNLDFIKAGAKKAVIEAEFDLRQRNDLVIILKNHSLDIEDNKVIIRKEINQSGSSRIFINDSPAQLSVLNEISEFLIDLHGQHQHQVLLHPENHLPYLDAFASLQSSVKDFSDLVKNYNVLKKQLQQFQNDRSKSIQMFDLYNFQLQELKEAEIQAGELDKLTEELKILSNYEKLFQNAQSLTDKLSAGDINAATLVTESLSHLKTISEIDHQFTELFENLKSARETIEEIGQFAERYISNLEFDPERAEFIRQRIAQIDFLVKKYQKKHADELADAAFELERKLNEINNYDSHLTQLEQEKKQLENIIIKSGKELSLKRKEAAREFENRLSAFLNEIGMLNSRFEFSQNTVPDPESPFEINQQKVKLTTLGFDDIRISFSPNPGEPIKAINKIASGGEISRIMLALKSVLAEKDNMPLLVFDEIDSGISGKVAQIVGKKISELSRYHQIVCITHLPQIAAFADSHYKVDKNITDKATNVIIKPLKFEEQVSEIANLLGGVSLSQQAIDNASQLLLEATKIK